MSRKWYCYTDDELQHIKEELFDDWNFGNGNPEILREIKEIEAEQEYRNPMVRILLKPK